MKIFRIISLVLFAFILVVVGFVTWLHFSDYLPDPVEVLSVESKAEPVPDTLSALIWNIGYAGLGSDMDFFY
ncbi:MAG: hypothetical protein R6U85_00050, partial [Salinivirgaceae bacterium]